jgi:hypothetical protein
MCRYLFLRIDYKPLFDYYSGYYNDGLIDLCKNNNFITTFLRVDVDDEGNDCFCFDYLYFDDNKQPVHIRCTEKEFSGEICPRKNITNRGSVIHTESDDGYYVLKPFINNGKIIL